MTDAKTETKNAYVADVWREREQENEAALERADRYREDLQAIREGLRRSGILTGRENAQ